MCFVLIINNHMTRAIIGTAAIGRTIFINASSAANKIEYTSNFYTYIVNLLMNTYHNCQINNSIVQYNGSDNANML